MSPEYQHLVDALPEHQREEAKKRIEWIEARNWKHIGLWTGYNRVTYNGQETFEHAPPDIDDLVGVQPDGLLKFCVAFYGEK